MVGIKIEVKKKKILIHSIAFSPDGVSTAYLYNDIALGLQQQGYEVVVLTTTPHYNVLPDELAKQPLQKKWGGLFYTSDFKGVKVYHVPQKKFKKAIFRVIGFVYWHILSFFLGIFQSRVALILSPSPPLTIGFISILIAKLKGAKTVYNVQEIYPDFLINQGNLTSGFIISILRKLESFVYNQSDKVVTIDEVFYQTIVNRFRDVSKLQIIPNFVDTDIYKPLSENELLLDKNLFPDKPVLKLMYAGNIGHAQDWEPLIDLAIKFSGMPVEFWVIGEGVLKEMLAKQIRDQHLQNIHLLPYQPRNSMASVVGYADLHFIFMNPQMDGQGFPSKVYTIMACKKPLLITSGTQTPLYHFLKDKECAFLVSETDFGKKCTAMEKIINEMLDKKSNIGDMGEKGLEVIRKKYSKTAVVKQYTDLCAALIN